MPASEGCIRFFGNEISDASTRIGYVPQIPEMEKSFPITAEEVVLSGFLTPALIPFFRFSSSHQEQARELLCKVGICSLAKRRVSELSGGEFQKMLIARALAVQPKLLILDEPTANIDAASRRHIYDILAELNETMTILVVTHDLVAISSHLKSLACLNRGLVYHGKPLLNESVIQNLYGCSLDMIAHALPVESDNLKSALVR